MAFGSLRTKFFTLLALLAIGIFTYARYIYSHAIAFPPLIQTTPFQLNIPPAQAALAPTGLGTQNATMLVLCRESDLKGILSSMYYVEKRFNSKFGYPWTFLNDAEFSEDFKQQIRAATKAPVAFGLIPEEHWRQPDWIDDYEAEQSRMRMKAVRVPYAGSVSYRNMCRFNSGFFFHHPLVQPYRYYWRVEPDIRLTCDVPYDPFEYMLKNNKIYGFTLMLPEYLVTIEHLWATVKEFMGQYPEYVHEHNAMDFISNDGGESYNMCHFWSNFEIGDMNFWRGDAYQKFFAMLESKGGFYYERWGDAPVHSIAAALFADRDQLHYFTDIGYAHHPIQNCPVGDVWTERTCDCPENKKPDWQTEKCTTEWYKAMRGSSLARGTSLTSGSE